VENGNSCLVCDLSVMKNVCVDVNCIKLQKQYVFFGLNVNVGALTEDVYMDSGDVCTLHDLRFSK